MKQPFKGGIHQLTKRTNMAGNALLDGNRLRIAAWVDAKDLKRLKNILDANEELIAAAEEDAATR